MRKAISLTVTFFLLLFLGTASAQEGLTTADCIKCHPQIVKTVDEKGAKHKSEITCLDCHEGHPPIKTDIIPQCSDCHTDSPHYQLAKCGDCHTDPHAPLSLTLAGDIKDPCLTCHADVGKEMGQTPSLHADLFCNKCHAAHRDIPKCLKCHEAHSEEMTAESCATCHPAHKPTVISYGQETPNSYCTSCHGEEGEALKKTETKHKELACVYCHRETHGVTPSCDTCHGVPHSPRMMARFPKCVTCHADAHNLE